MSEKNCVLSYGDELIWAAYPMEDPLDNTHYIPGELLDEYKKAIASVDEAIRKMLEFVKASGQTVP